jgi:predicted hydrolase (HD superfamily)
MADEKATFAIVLEDETSGAADAAAASLETLRKKIDEDTAALGQMRKAMRQMKKAGLDNTNSFKVLASSAKGLEARLGASQSEFVRLGGGVHQGEA